ncbi:MAG: proline--tRNA ligase, partial [Leptospiraceae bacterium]|nr:proline--tRNA ligase [Leptospiraceae bacterium]
MRATQFIIATLREAPADAVAVSHNLMLRAGLIRKLGAGLYHLLPAGLRSFRKVEQVIREEMNAAGALEMQLPILTPAELWERSQRWESMGRAMFRVQDRHDVWNVLGPTHEESFSELVAGLIHSYRDLPLNVYQIHTKFRDEIRPRYGVIRSREFCM